MRLLGHAKLDTTALYTRVANTTIRAVTGPLDPLRPKRAHAQRPASRADRRLDPRIGFTNPVLIDEEDGIRPSARSRSPRSWLTRCANGGSRAPRASRTWCSRTEKGRVQYHINIHRRGLGPLQVAAGITTDPRHPKYGLHSLRHAAASLFIEQSFSPKRVQALMGHSTIQMTFDVCGHLFPSAADDQAAMTQLQARLLVA